MNRFDHNGEPDRDANNIGLTLGETWITPRGFGMMCIAGLITALGIHRGLDYVYKKTGWRDLRLPKHQQATSALTQPQDGKDRL